MSLELEALAQLRLAAASGLVCCGAELLVLADDELVLQRYSHTGVYLGQALLLSGELPAEPAARKRRKPDFEMLCLLPDGRLLALGSGSTPERRRGVLWQAGSAQLIDLSGLYLALEARLTGLNLEGAVVRGEQLLLAQRGNNAGSLNAMISLDLATLLSQLAGASLGPESLRAVTPVELGELHGVPLSFTDLCLAADGRLLFSAAAEDTDSSYLDGACAGSVLGCLADAQVQALWPLVGSAKIEGLCQLADGSLRLVNDPDDRSARSSLYSVVLPT
ncbi:MAG TPA: hypothetical protein VJ047_15870 [Pseudomonas sp.]|nr:hypothetical protein [Pseudomonas sp.]